MTSVKSSADTFGFTFRRTLRKNFLAPLGLFVVFMAYFTEIFSVISNYKYDLVNTKGFDGEAFLAARKFVFINSDATDYGFSVYIIQMFLVIVSVVLAVNIFRFVASKKMVNVYYSLGVTRENMFISKYLCGALMLTAAILIPMLISLFGNIYFFGGSHELYVSFLYLFFEYLVTAMFCFSVTAAVMSCVGSVVEAGIYTAILVFTPTIINYAIEKFLSAFLYGAPYGYNYYVLGEGTRTAQTFSILKLLNPLSSLVYGDSYYCYNYIQFDAANPDSLRWTEPSFLHCIIWGVATAVVFAAGLAIFKHRKAEYSGFLGVSRPITAVCIFMPALYISSYFVGQMNNISSGVAVLIGCVSMLALFSLTKLVLFRSFKAYIKKLYLVLPYCAVYAAVCLIFALGLTGYSAKLPDIDEIKSVSVTTGTANNIVNPYNSGITDFTYEDSSERENGMRALRSITLESYGSCVIPGFTSQKDIQTVLDAHNILAANKDMRVTPETINVDSAKHRVYPTDLYFYYELKNGKTFERKYDCANGEVLELLASLQNSNVYKAYAAERLSAPETEDESIRIGYATGGYVFSSDYSVGFISKNLITRTPVDIINESPELREQMIAAVCEDIKAGRAHTDIKSDKPAIGFICSYGGFARFDVKDTINKDDSKGFFTTGNYGSDVIPVYEDMTSTMAFLTENDLTGLFDDTVQPVSAKVCKLLELSKDECKSFYSTSSQLAGCVYYDNCGAEKIFPTDAKEFTNASQVKQIADNTTYSTLNCHDGWYVELTYADGVTAYGFLPEQYLPQ